MAPPFARVSYSHFWVALRPVFPFSSSPVTVTTYTPSSSPSSSRFRPFRSASTVHSSEPPAATVSRRSSVPPVRRISALGRRSSASDDVIVTSSASLLSFSVSVTVNTGHRRSSASTSWSLLFVFSARSSRSSFAISTDGSASVDRPLSSCTNTRWRASWPSASKFSSMPAPLSSVTSSSACAPVKGVLALKSGSAAGPTLIFSRPVLSSQTMLLHR